MPTTIEAIESAIIKTIKDVSGYNIVINERCPGPRPIEPHASYRTLDAEGQDYPDRRYEGDPLEIIGDVTNITSRILFTGKDAFSKLKSFCIALRSANRFKIKDLYAIIGLGGIEPVQNVSIPDENGRVVEQAAVHISWYAEIASQEQIDAFNKVNIAVSPNINIEVNGEVIE